MYILAMIIITSLLHDDILNGVKFVVLLHTLSFTLLHKISAVLGERGERKAPGLPLNTQRCQEWATISTGRRCASLSVA